MYLSEPTKTQGEKIVGTKGDPKLEAARIAEVVEDWTKVLSETAPMVREAAGRAVLGLYESAGLKRPIDARLPAEKDAGPEIVFCDGVRDYYRKADEFAGKIRSTDAAAAKFTKKDAQNALSTPWSDGNWLAADDYYCKYIATAAEARKSHPIQFLKEFARNAFALALFEKVAFVIERPCKIVYREQGTVLQWHNTGGAVLEWPDGEQVYAIEGFFVDEQLVMHPETQTIEQIHEEQNLELRRIRIERYGWDKYLAASGAKVIDKRRNDVDGGCYEALCDVPELEARVLLCTCPTGRVFNLLVPVSTATCADAKSYLVGNPKLQEIGRT